MSFCTLLDKFVSETYYHDAQMLLFWLKTFKIPKNNILHMIYIFFNRFLHTEINKMFRQTDKNVFLIKF